MIADDTFFIASLAVAAVTLLFSTARRTLAPHGAVVRASPPSSRRMSRSLSFGPAARRWTALVRTLAWRDIQIRYKQSVMGFFWAVLMPAMVVGAGVLVQYAMASYAGRPVESRNLAAVAVRAVPWAFFVGAVRFAMMSLISNASLITKIYLPREVFPVAAVVAQFVDFCVASVTMAIVLAFAGVHASVVFWWLPILIIGLVLLCAGLGAMLAAGALFFRDVKYLVDLLLMFAIFFTPVFFPLSAFGRFKDIALLNPVAPFLIGFSDVVVEHRAPSAWLAYGFAVAILICLVGFGAFRRLDPLFAERI